MTVCQSNPAARTSCSSSSCAASVIWHALPTPPAAAAPAADFGEKRVKITTVLERVVIGDRAFRAEELKEPAVLVLARASRVCVRRDSYAEVCGSSGTARMTNGGTAAAARPAVGRQSRRQHHVGTDGTLTINRRGRTLCQIWQEGQCFTLLVNLDFPLFSLLLPLPDFCRTIASLCLCVHCSLVENVRHRT